MAAAGGGGAWKVAYADFVTAMMALFMVLWISAQDEKILIATSRYFQNPFHSPMNATAGVLPFNSNKTSQSEGKEAGNAKEQDRNKQIELTFLNSVAADFHRLLHLDENLKAKPIDIQVTADGLRITLFDHANRRLFVDDTSEFTEWGQFVLQSLAWIIERHRLRVIIDGHTRSGLPVQPAYSAWELSTDRANAARRRLVQYAVGPEFIERVAGFADTRPFDAARPEAEGNQRITLSLALSARGMARENKKTDRPAKPALPPPKTPPPPNS